MFKNKLVAKPGFEPLKLLLRYFICQDFFFSPGSLEWLIGKKFIFLHKEQLLYSNFCCIQSVSHPEI